MLIPGTPEHPLRVFTWHIHGSYLYYLLQTGHDFYVPVKPGRPPRYVGITPSYPWPRNLHEVNADQVRDLDFDCVLFQHHENYLHDQFEVLSHRQRCLPRIYLEHDPPRQHPTDTRHPVDDPAVQVVHVTAFNDLMWDCSGVSTRVIDHGVVIPGGVHYSGELPRGIAIVNNIRLRGRRLGSDVLDRVRSRVPIDLIGMGWKEAGGIGEVPHAEIPHFISRYRFVFNPIRYTSLGLAICEAMMVGLPVVGFATAEMATVIRNGQEGYVDTSLDKLIGHMERLINSRDEATALSRHSKTTAQKRFNIDRFVRDWNETFSLIKGAETHGEKHSYHQ